LFADVAEALWRLFSTPLRKLIADGVSDAIDRRVPLGSIASAEGIAGNTNAPAGECGGLKWTEQIPPGWFADEFADSGNGDDDRC